MNTAKVFGQYEILDRVSVGGMAEVFRARHSARGNIVALKRMLPEVAEDDEAIEMFEDEARICIRLEHPHIARMLDFGRVGRSFFIAFEYVRGRDLRYVFDRAVRTKEEIPAPIVLYVLARIAEGLAYAHARKDENGVPISIVHRDVSPQNIVVSFDGDVKLIDFGIAKAAGRLSRTQAGAIKGKFGYMSPEQVTGQPLDARTDVFSLGICLWELLTRERLFYGQNELIVLEKIKNLAILPPSEVPRTGGTRLPPELDAIVLKALAKDPAERYRAARDLYRDLNIFCETHDFVATRSEIAQYMRRTFPEASGRDLAPRSSSSPPRSIRDVAPDTQREDSPLEREASSSERSGMYGPDSDLTAVRRNDEEMMNMAAEKQGGSDLDIFEGLGKKNSAQPTRQSSAPPPPPSSMKTPAASPSAPPQVVRGDMAVGKKTLLGVQSPLGGQAGAGSAAPPSQRSVPASRASLPAVSAPPQKNLAQSGSHAVPAAAETKPAAYLEAAAKKADTAAQAGAAVEMDWDDDEEATHVLDRDEKEATKPPSGENLAFAKTALAGGSPVGTPSSSRVPSARVSAPPPLPSGPVSQRAPAARPSNAPPVPPPSLRPGAATMKPSTGLSAPPPPPPPPSAGFRTVPPSPASQGPGSLSRPPVPPPGPISQQAMRGPVSQGMSQMGQAAGSFPPPVSNQHAANQHPSQNPFQQPIQTHTAPLSMPATSPSGPPRQAYQSVPPPSLPPVQAVPGMGSMKSRMMEETQLVRPTSKAGLWIGLVVAAALAVALVVMLLPHSSKLAINVVDAKGATINRVDVFVDGKKQCETAPCIIDVSAGAHEVKALAGNDATTKAITVESRKDSTTELVLANGAAGGGTGIKVQGQSGIKLSVDGKDIGPLPQEVKDLTPGDHKIKLSGDRYETLEKNVTVAKDEMQDLGAITLKVVKGKATITLGTAGARVYLVSGSDRRDLPTFPISVDIDTSKSWTLEAVKPGFQDYKQPISFADGNAEKTFDVQLSPKGAAVSSFTPPPVTHNTTPTTPKPPKNNDGETSSSGSGSSTAGGEAFLTMNSLPASAVVLDGKPLGQTPQIKVSVPSGEHTITFINSDQGLKKTMKVTVGAGETKPVIAKLKSE